MIHVVFNEADVEVLRQAIALDDSLEGATHLIRDDFAVGPVKDIYTPEGAAARTAWWKEVLTGSDHEDHCEQVAAQDVGTVKSIQEQLTDNPDEVLWIWAAQNKHDVSGYYWLMSQLKDYQGKVFILYLNNLPFLNEKGQLFYPHWLHTIPPKEFLKAKKLARPITPSEFEVDPDEWTRLCNEEKQVRILEGGKKLVQYEADFYDKDLKKYVTGDWQKAARIIHQFQHKNAESTGDLFLLWRLKCIIQNASLDVQGALKGMKDFEVKLQGAAAAVDTNE